MYGNLRKCLNNKGISVRAAALAIGMPEATFRTKLDLEGRMFSVDEAFAIKDGLFPEIEMRYLFKNTSNEVENAPTQENAS